MTIFYQRGFFDDRFSVPPQGAVAVSDTQYLKLLEGQAQGKQIIANEQGYPVLIEPQPSPYHKLQGMVWVLDETKQAELINAKCQELVNNIDDIASTITDKWTRFIAEYEEREKAAKTFASENYKGEPSIWITAFSHSAGLDNKTATQLILKQAEQLRTLQTQLGALRMRKYELKKPNLTLEQMQEIHDDIIKNMQKLAEEQQ